MVSCPMSWAAIKGSTRFQNQTSGLESAFCGLLAPGGRRGAALGTCALSLLWLPCSAV